MASKATANAAAEPTMGSFAAAIAPEPVPLAEQKKVRMHLGGRQFIYEGKLYFSEDGGPIEVPEEHASILANKMDRMDKAEGVERELEPTDPLAGASRNDLLAEIRRLRVSQSAPSDAEDGGQEAPPPDAPPAQPSTETPPAPPSNDPFSPAK